MARLVLIHQKKTGGTSVYRALSDFFHPEKVGAWNDVNALESAEAHSFVAGHYDAQDLKPDDVAITFVRNPIVGSFLTIIT